MTITRDEIRRLRDSCREHSGDPDSSASIVGALNDTANQLDMLDACLARESIHTLYPGCHRTSNGEEPLPANAI